jgi:PDZ domain-containing protein
MLAGVLVANGLLSLNLIPTPFWWTSPGRDVDLTDRIDVPGFPGPKRRYDLLEVKFNQATVARYAWTALNHRDLIPSRAIIPRASTLKASAPVPGTSRNVSQEAAAVVAERAAGYAVPLPIFHALVLDVLPGAGARDVLQRDDLIESVNGVPVSTAHDVADVLANVPPGDGVYVDVRRGALRFRLLVPTAAEAPRFGVILQSVPQPARLAVPVTFNLNDVAGPSGGLMMALRIYDSLRGGMGHGFPHIAGTGTIDYAGHVGPIIGASQKIIAAKAAGATTFFCSRANYEEVRDAKGIRVIPVDTFDEALEALGVRTDRAPL